MNRLPFLITAALLIPICAARGTADERPAGNIRTTFGSLNDGAAAADPAPQRWLLLTCGLTGDDDHRERMTQACRDILSFAAMTLSVPVERVRFLAADEQMQSELTDLSEGSQICTAATVKAAVTELGEEIPATGSCWVIMIGHGHFYGKHSQYNVLDQDFDQTEFGEWANALQCEEQVFWLTFPTSGYWLRSLRNDARVVISATGAELEFTGTEMPYALADVLAGTSEHARLEDVDQDGQTSLLDLYLAASLEIDGDFKAIERLQTEHSLLDDNSDGRGSELQAAYIPVDAEEPTDEEAESSEPANDDPDDEGVTEEPVETDQTAAVNEDDDDAKPGDSDDAPAVQRPPPITNRNLDGYRSRFIFVSPVDR